MQRWTSGQLSKMQGRHHTSLMKTIDSADPRGRVSCSLVARNRRHADAEARGEVHRAESLVTRPRQLRALPQASQVRAADQVQRPRPSSPFHLGTGSHIVGAADEDMQPRRAARSEASAANDRAGQRFAPPVRSTGRDRTSRRLPFPSYRGKRRPPRRLGRRAAWPAAGSIGPFSIELRDEAW